MMEEIEKTVEEITNLMFKDGETDDRWERGWNAAIRMSTRRLEAILENSKNEECVL